MLDHEPFLKAIFADPDNDLPRLVFADYLEEQGDAAWAEFIRVQCELARRERFTLPGDDRDRELIGREWDLFRSIWYRGQSFQTDGGGLVARRGFPTSATASVTADVLADPDGFRRTAVSEHPEWYGATRLKVTDGRITSPGPLSTIFTSPVTEHVTMLDLSGRVTETPVRLADVTGDPHLPLIDLELSPTVTVAVVDALAQSPDARRLTDLDLTNNDLDNDAARALARSTNLYRLKRLAIYNGNRFRARTWQQLIERFGPDVVL